MKVSMLEEAICAARSACGLDRLAPSPVTDQQYLNAGGQHTLKSFTKPVIPAWFWSSTVFSLVCKTDVHLPLIAWGRAVSRNLKSRCLKGEHLVVLPEVDNYKWPYKERIHSDNLCGECRFCSWYRWGFSTESFLQTGKNLDWKVFTKFLPRGTDPEALTQPVSEFLRLTQHRGKGLDLRGARGRLVLKYEANSKEWNGDDILVVTASLPSSLLSACLVRKPSADKGHCLCLVQMPMQSFCCWSFCFGFAAWNLGSRVFIVAGHPEKCLDP